MHPEFSQPDVLSAFLVRPAAGITAAMFVCLLATAPPAAAQSLERTRLIDPPDAGLPWTLDVAPEFRLTRDAEVGGARLGATFHLALGLPHWLRGGVGYSPQSLTVPGRPDEWEAYARWTAVAQQRGAPLDAALHAGFNGAAASPDAELALARWFGPVRLTGVGRVLGDAFSGGATRGAAGAGVVVLPHARGMPISLSGDAVTLLDRDADAGERVAWSVAVNAGVSFTTHTLSIFATNTPSASLHGRSRGDGRTRWGVALTAPIAAGQLLGLVAPRERGLRAVADVAGTVAAAVPADIYRYAYPQQRLVIERGTTVEWTNRDAVVHTVSADDGSWDSGAIQPGARWRARFDEPGIYPFHCGPHPFMKGTVIVR